MSTNRDKPFWGLPCHSAPLRHWEVQLLPCRGPVWRGGTSWEGVCYLVGLMPADLCHCCGHPACHEKCQDQLPGALLLTAGSSFLSFVQCSFPLPCMNRLVAILLLLLLRCLLRARPSSEWLVRGCPHGARAPWPLAWTGEPSWDAGCQSQGCDSPHPTPAARLQQAGLAR